MIVSGEEFFGGKPGKVVLPAQEVEKELDKEGFFSRVGTDLVQRGRNIKDAYLKSNKGFDSEINPLRAGVRIAGEIAGGLGDIATQAVKSAGDVTGITENVVKPASAAILNTTIGKKGLEAIQGGAEVYSAFKERNPEVAEDLEAVLNISAIFPVGKAGQVAGKGVQTLRNSSTGIVDKTIDLGKKATFSANQKVSEKIIAPMAEKSIQNYSEDLGEFFTKTKRGTRLVTNEQIQGKNTADFLAKKLIQVDAEERVNYMPTVEGGEFKPQNTVTFLRRDAEILDEALTDILESEGKNVDLNEIRQRMLKEVRTDMRLKRAEADDAAKVVNELMDKYINQYGENVPLVRVQDIKQGLYSKGYADFDPSKGVPNLQKSVSRDMGRVAKDVIEENVDDFNVKAINKDIGDHYASIELLEKMAGDKVKGGRLGRYTARLIGAAAGSSHGFLGTLTGAAGADLVAQFLIDNSISSPIRNALIKQLSKKNPEILEKALKKVQVNKSSKLLPQGSEKVTRINTPIPMRAPIKDEKAAKQIFNQSILDPQKNLLPERAQPIKLPPPAKRN